MSSMVSGVQNVAFLGEIQSADGKKIVFVGPSNRKEDLPADTLDLSTKKEKKKNENSLINSIGKSLTNGVKSFVNMTVEAFTKTASEVVIDRTIGKIAKK